MAAAATKTIFANLEDQLEDYLADEIDDAVRFDGDPASAIESRLGHMGGKGCLVFFGFDRREPSIFSGQGIEIHTEMPVEFIVVVENKDRDGYQSDIEYLDDVMDKLSDEALTHDNFSTDNGTGWWNNGIEVMRDGPIRGLSLGDTHAIGRAIRKTITRKKT